MDIRRTGDVVELSPSAEVVRRRGVFLLAFGLIAFGAGAAASTLGFVRVATLVGILLGAVCIPLGLYFTAFASRIADQRHVLFDRAKQTIVGGRGARTVMFRAVDHLCVVRTPQIHALEVMLKNGTSWRLHAESTQNPAGCDGMAQAASQIAEATGLPLR
jgi:hypothetical protein